MQKDPVVAFLAGALCVVALVVFVLALSCEIYFRQFRVLQPKVANVQYTQNLIISLTGDLMEYSKRNPAIDPILQNVGLKPGKAAPAAKPSAK